MERVSGSPPELLRVLALCDDAECSVMGMLGQARRHAFEVTPVATVEDALTHLGRGRQHVCLVCCDPPSPTARKLLAALRDVRSSTKVVLVARSYNADDEAEAMRLGAADYLTEKEATPALLERSVALAIETARRTGTLQRSEADFRTLIEVSPEAMIVHQRGVVLYVNPAVVDLLGYGSKLDLVARPVHEIVNAEDLQTVWAEMRTYAEQGRSAPLREVRFTRRDGSTATAEVVAIPIVLENDKAILSVARDVTERKEMQARMLFADRMASMGTLAAGVAHEINNPLAYITANLDYLAEELSTTFSLVDGLDEVRKAVFEARDGAERVRHIVRDLKTFSRADEERRVHVDVRRVLESSANMAHNEIRHRAKLVKDLQEVPLVMANEARLGQVFLNLLVNAAQAIPEGNAAKHQIRIASFREGGLAVVEIVDTGSGISPEILQRIFLPFFTTKPIGLGTGLGLAICQSIVTALGGTIHVTSKVDHGTTFRVTLPPAKIDAPEKASSSKPTREVRRGRLLILDDEPQIGAALRRALHKEHDVVSLTDAREALARLREGERFDVIFCDLMMPDMTGMEFFAEIERKLPEVASSVVFFTGGAFTQRAQSFLDNVSNPRLEKPPNLRSIRELLRDRVR